MSRKRPDSSAQASQGRQEAPGRQKRRGKKQKTAADVQSLGYTPREWDRLNQIDAAEGKKQRFLVLLAVVMSAVAVFLIYSVWYVVFRSHDYDLSLPYDRSSSVFGFPGESSHGQTAASFAQDLCVTDTDVDADSLNITSLSAGLFDLTLEQVMYAKDIFTTRDPASMTKIMTALVALKYGNPDDLVTVTDTAKDIEYGSSVCDIHTGDVLSLRQLLYGMIVASGNDAAMMIAEHVGGSVEHFVELMNEEAASIGATRTHFANPHGLTDENHYTCVYDLYLIFNAARSYDLFMDMISRKNYYAEYTNANGTATAVTWESTNYYFTGEATAPDHVIIYGGKTGTTQAAGACLALLSKDDYGNPYISIIMHSEDHDYLYQDMNAILGLVALKSTGT